MQKEKDALSDELDAIKERFEANQSMAMKAVRDKDQLQTELDVVKDRWEKAHMVHQKLQVRFIYKTINNHLKSLYIIYIYV